MVAANSVDSFPGLDTMLASRISPVGVLAAAACLLAGCGARTDDRASAPPVPTLRVGYVGHDHQLALYVAALESERRRARWGLYLRELKPKEVYELVVEDTPLARLQLIPTQGGAGMPAALSRGEFEVGLGSTIGVAKFADAGQDLRILGPLQTDGDQFVLRRELAIADWPAFVAAAKAGGRPFRIGYKEPLAVAKLIFERALQAEGIAYGYDERPGVGVALVSFGSEKAPLPLLEGGVLDGFVMNQPATAMAVHKGLANVVAELRDLPPAGQWVDHPCCCVAASEAAVRRSREPVKALLKLLLLATELIHEDRELAIDCASRWTKNPREIESQSVPSVTYLAEPTEGWRAGMGTWLEMVRSEDFFQGRYARASAEAFTADLCRLELCQEAARELRAQGLLTPPVPRSP